MPTGKKSSVKLYQENPGKYELNTKSNGPTYVPKGTQKHLDDDDEDRGDIDRSYGSAWQDYAETSEDF